MEALNTSSRSATWQCSHTSSGLPNTTWCPTKVWLRGHSSVHHLEEAVVERHVEHEAMLGLERNCLLGAGCGGMADGTTLMSATSLLARGDTHHPFPQLDSGTWAARRAPAGSAAGAQRGATQD